MQKKHLPLLLMIILFILVGLISSSDALAREERNEAIEVMMDRGGNYNGIEPVIYELPDDVDPELKRKGMPAQIEQKLPIQVQEKKQDRSEKRQEHEENLRSMNRSERAEERMSDVAKSVQLLLDNPDKEGGIGEEVRGIAKQQQDSQEDLEENLDNIHTRNGLTKFIIGPDRKALNSIKKETSQIDGRITKLKSLLSSIVNEQEQENLNTLIEDLEGQRNDLLETVEFEDSSFSLLGWMKRLF